MANPDYFEPWSAEPARDPESRDWLIWGSGMMEWSVVTNLDGTPQAVDGRRIITRFGTIVSDRGDAHTAGRLAQRAAACVSACAGIKDPALAIPFVQALLLELALGSTIDPRRANRAATLLHSYEFTGRPANASD